MAQESKSGFGLLLAGLAALVIVVAVFSSTHVVPPGHRGVSVTLGRVSTQVCGEGLAFKKPFGIETIRNVSIQQQKSDGEAACYSSDTQTLHVKFTVMWKQPEPRVIEIFQQYQGDPYTALVDSRVQEAIKQTTAQYTAEMAIKSREQIRATSLERLRKEVGDILTIVDLNITNVDLTDQLEAAIEAKMVQAQQALAKQYELDKANKDAEITIVKANAEAKAITVTAEAIAKSPSVIQLEIIKKWNGVSPSTVVVGSGEGANLVFPVGGVGGAKGK